VQSETLLEFSTGRSTLGPSLPMRRPEYVNNCCDKRGRKDASNVSHDQFMMQLWKLLVPSSEVCSNIHFPGCLFRRLLQGSPVLHEPVAFAHASAWNNNIDGKVNEFVDHNRRINLRNTKKHDFLCVSDIGDKVSPIRLYNA
jgi:hypothetical protein